LADATPTDGATAIVTHVRYREFDRLVVPVVLLVVSILVAVGAHGL